MSKYSKPDGAITHKGVFYFTERESAHAWAVDNEWPTDRIIPYGLGYAVQACVSGRYAGPDEHPYTHGETWNRHIAN